MRNDLSTKKVANGRSPLSYQREILKLKDLVRNMTWVQPTYNGSPSCACCGAMQHRGHVAGCHAAKLEIG